MKQKERITIAYEIYLTKRANYNLNQIEYYIKYELENPIVANNIISKLINKIFILKQFPYIGKKYNEKDKSDRFIIYKNFLIFYEIQEKEKIILIKTIMHRNINKDTN